MTSWASGGSNKPPSAPGGSKFDTVLGTLAADLVIDGDDNVAMKTKAFAQWRIKLRALPTELKPLLAEQILMLANRYFQNLGVQAEQGISQLVVLASDLGVSREEMPEAPAKKTKSAAKAKPSAPKAALKKKK